MTSTVENADRVQGDAPSFVGARPLVFAGLASIGAGLIHAAAIGVHNEHRQVVILFTAVAIFQVGWGVFAMLVDQPRARAVVAITGLVGSAALFFGFVLAKTSGIAFVDGLETAEPVEFADGLAGAFAATAVILAAADLLRSRSTDVRRGAWAMGVGAVIMAVLTVPAMIAAADPAHHAGAGGGHGDEHADSNEGHDAGAAAAEGHQHAGHGVSDTQRDPASVVARPYDPNEPVDLGGVEGVTSAQQAAAENVVSATLLLLPRWSDPAVAEAGGFRSIGDSSTGYEHFVNLEYMRDGRELDPSVPESLVYRINSMGERELVAAMYMAEPGKTLETVPNFGGALTQWHVHEDLCFTPDGTLSGVISTGEQCLAPLVKMGAVPMIHVWITPHECGPFASLEGVGAGQVKDGEVRACDSEHGGH